MAWACRRAAAASAPGISSVNSSPPQRAATSSVRLQAISASGDVHEGRAAAGVAEAVVQALQLVDVEQQQRHGLPEALRAVEAAPVVVLERLGVGEPGQGIALREFPEVVAAAAQLFRPEAGDKSRGAEHGARADELIEVEEGVRAQVGGRIARARRHAQEQRAGRSADAEHDAGQRVAPDGDAPRPLRRTFESRTVAHRRIVARSGCDTSRRVARLSGRLEVRDAAVIRKLSPLHHSSDLRRRPALRRARRRAGRPCPRPRGCLRPLLRQQHDDQQRFGRRVRGASGAGARVRLSSGFAAPARPIWSRIRRSLKQARGLFARCARSIPSGRICAAARKPKTTGNRRSTNRKRRSTAGSTSTALMTTRTTTPSDRQRDVRRRPARARAGDVRDPGPPARGRGRGSRSGTGRTGPRCARRRDRAGGGIAKLWALIDEAIQTGVAKPI